MDATEEPLIHRRVGGDTSSSKLPWWHSFVTISAVEGLLGLLICFNGIVAFLQSNASFTLTTTTWLILICATQGLQVSALGWSRGRATNLKNLKSGDTPLDDGVAARNTAPMLFYVVALVQLSMILWYVPSGSHGRYALDNGLDAETVVTFVEARYTAFLFLLIITAVIYLDRVSLSTSNLNRWVTQRRAGQPHQPHRE